MNRLSHLRISDLELFITAAHLKSLSKIADICACSNEVGFLPDFLALRMGLHPVEWQPKPSGYRVLALHHSAGEALQQRLNNFISQCQKIFAGSR